MALNNRSKWGLALGVVGSFVLAATLTVSMARSADAQDAGSQTPPPTQGGNDAASGRRIYDRACGRCHPGGNEDVGPRLINLRHSEAQVRTQIRNGQGRMRPIPTSRLPDSDMPALMTYLRSIHTVQ